VADLIKDEYPDSESLSSAVEGRALNNWQENKGTETEVHISEFLGLYHMESIISNSNKLLSDCGFQSVNEFEDQMENIREFRNRVMHANKTLVHDREDLREMVECLVDINTILSELTIVDC